MPITGAAPIPSQFDKGINAYWNDVNAKGGIDGRKVKVVIEDTQSQAEVGKDKAKKLIEEDHVFTIVVLDRLENQEAIGKYLDDRKFPNIEVQTPANLPQDQVWTFGVTIDHQVQGKLVADYFVHVLNATKVGIVSENTPTLEPGRSEFTKEIAALHATVVVLEDGRRVRRTTSRTKRSGCRSRARRPCGSTWLPPPPPSSPTRPTRPASIRSGSRTRSRGRSTSSS